MSKDLFFPSGRPHPMMGDFVCDARNPFRTGTVAITKTFSVYWMDGQHEYLKTSDVLPGGQTTAVLFPIPE